MKRTNRLVANVLVVLAAAVSVVSCTNDLTRNTAPVELLVTNSQALQRIDLAGGTGCNQDVGTIQMKAIVKTPATTGGDNRFNDVRVTSYRVSYVRTDGGRLVPASFVRSMDTLLTANGGAESLSKFIVVQGDALTQAPFAALLPANGGRDPETGRAQVTMDVVVEVFGTTLAGESVSGSTRFPLDFCISCGGCS